jgi:3-oxoacyl-[acyl-carrier protein] reductase
MPRLDDRVALITGSGRGIGRATALRLARDGASVVVNDLDLEPAAETVALIEGEGGRAVTAVGDTSDLEVAHAVVGAAVEASGSSTSWSTTRVRRATRCSTASATPPSTSCSTPNLRTAFHTTLAAMPHLREVAKREMAENGGRPRYQRKIVFTSSVAALMGNPGQANYTVAKGGLIALTKTLARELGPFGINVNAVAPGFVETRLTQAKTEGEVHGIPEQMRQMSLMLIALGRFGQPEDIANVTAFLVSSDADFISGVTIPVTGGQLGGM